MSLSSHDPAMGKLLGDPKPTGPVPGSEKKQRADDAASGSSAPPPKKRPLAKFPVKVFNYEIEKAR
jgi:hypothetical protein